MLEINQFADKKAQHNELIRKQIGYQLDLINRIKPSLDGKKGAERARGEEVLRKAVEEIKRLNKLL